MKNIFIATLSILFFFAGTNKMKAQVTKNCSYFDLTGAKLIKHEKINLKQVKRGEEIRILSFDINLDGKPDEISFLFEETIYNQKIISSFGDLLEQDDFMKNKDSDLCISLVEIPDEKQPLVIIYYNSSNIDNSLESLLYIFKLKSNKWVKLVEQTLSYGSFTDEIDFTKMKISDNYGSQGLLEEYSFKIN